MAVKKETTKVSETKIITLDQKVIIERIGFLPNTVYAYGVELDFTQKALELRTDIAEKLIEEGLAV